MPHFDASTTEAAKTGAALLRSLLQHLLECREQPMTDAALLPAGAAADMPEPVGASWCFSPSGETILLLNVDRSLLRAGNTAAPMPVPRWPAAAVRSCADLSPAHGLKFDIRNGPGARCRQQ